MARFDQTNLDKETVAEMQYKYSLLELSCLGSRMPKSRYIKVDADFIFNKIMNPHLAQQNNLAFLNTEKLTRKTYLYHHHYQQFPRLPLLLLFRPESEKTSFRNKCISLYTKRHIHRDRRLSVHHPRRSPVRG